MGAHFIAEKQDLAVLSDRFRGRGESGRGAGCARFLAPGGWGAAREAFEGAVEVGQVVESAGEGNCQHLFVRGAQPQHGRLDPALDQVA